MTDYPSDTIDLCEDVNSKILDAAIYEDLVTLKQLMQCTEADVNTQEEPVCTEFQNSVSESPEKGKGCGRTPLWWSVYNNNLTMVRFLLEQPNINGGEYGKMEDSDIHSDVNFIYMKSHFLLTPLMIASIDNNAVMVKLMLTYPTFKRNINQKSVPHLYTSLNYAANYAYQEVVLALLSEPSVNVNAQTKSGWTPLRLAAWQGNVEIVSILLRCNKTDITIQDSENKTALEVAKEKKEEAISQQREDWYIERLDDVIKLLESRAAGQTPPGDPTC